MSNTPSRKVLNRLLAIDWADDTAAFQHAPSRALLMREYLRRAALWAQSYKAERSWPFFDIAAHIDVTITTPLDVTEDLEQLLKDLAPASLRTTCSGAVRWAALRDARPDLLEKLPDPYEPLLRMYERGGGFYLQEYLDLNGVMIPLRNVESNASTTPLVTLSPATLDALDGEGESTYFAKISDGYPRHSPRGIVRRRVDDDQTHDEAFTRNLRWEPTEYLKLYDLGHNDIDHVQITEIEAATFIETLTEKLAGPS
ncbi:MULTISPECIES: hypothetical protein [Streptomyces]|uniref:hypothetical protein n=1 Tax=Streptomyces TaxID=1883 RepID=UPI000BF0BC5C|nr:MULTISPECIES: hypothetical protein [Streptomyces]WSI77650.1 hypothetical protein OG557_12140 [Streptomyces anulatus]WTE26315.1 hypothetical protein OHB50_12070 [Streptomyces anulatus]